jgi:hypothetical protein
VTAPDPGLRAACLALATVCAALIGQIAAATGTDPADLIGQLRAGQLQTGGPA